MHARGRTRRIKWWVWVTMLAVGFVAGALGFGWFLVIAVGLTWATVELFNRAKERPPDELDPRTLMAQSPSSARSAIGTAASSSAACGC